jgi:hypothetical protein
VTNTLQTTFHASVAYSSRRPRSESAVRVVTSGHHARPDNCAGIHSSHRKLGSDLEGFDLGGVGSCASAFCETS